ncbi:MAG: hypothetical protein QM733_05880 [Ilumatobacteraceae bacterium]
MVITGTVDAEMLGAARGPPVNVAVSPAVADSQALVRALANAASAVIGPR